MQRHGQDDFATIFQSAINGLPAQVAILDMHATIIAVNRAWRRFPIDQGLTTAPDCIGVNYLSICQHADKDCPEASRIATGIERIIAGERSAFQHRYRLALGAVIHRFAMSVSLVRFQTASFMIVSHQDVTEIDEARRTQRRFRASLLNAQADERRRIAQELHDSTAQHLVAAELGLEELRALGRLGADADAYERITTALGHAHQEIRTLSYLLHPPGIGPHGLVPALRAMLEGFGRRTGLGVSLEAESDMLRCDASTQATLFRVTQEALANVRKHARASGVSVSVMERRGATLLEISDNGVGLPASAVDEIANLGLGLRNMRARIEELGGRFEVRAGARGVTVSAEVPLRHQASTMLLRTA